MASALLFGAIPGGPELLIILLVVILLLGVPLALVVLAGTFGYSLSRSRDGRRAADAARVDELERELAETRAQLRDLRAERGADDDAEAADSGPGDRRR